MVRDLIFCFVTWGLLGLVFGLVFLLHSFTCSIFVSLLVMIDHAVAFFSIPFQAFTKRIPFTGTVQSVGIICMTNAAKARVSVQYYITDVPLYGITCFSGVLSLLFVNINLFFFFFSLMYDYDTHMMHFFSRGGGGGGG